MKDTKFMWNGKEFRMRFKYRQYDIPQYVDKWAGEAKAKATVRCELLESTFEKEALYGEGEAHCSTKDTFNRDTGRKLALLRAMKDLGMDKEARTMVWNTVYFGE